MTKPKTVARVTRHAATSSQRRELQRLFGDDVRIVELNMAVKDVSEVLRAIAAVKADAVEVVLPDDIKIVVVERLNSLGVPVLESVMTRKWREGVAQFFFSHYVKVESFTKSVLDLRFNEL